MAGYVESGGRPEYRTASGNDEAMPPGPRQPVARGKTVRTRSYFYSTRVKTYPIGEPPLKLPKF